MTFKIALWHPILLCGSQVLAKQLFSATLEGAGWDSTK